MEGSDDVQVGENLLVTFRQIDPPGRVPGICWVAELHTDDDQPPYPLAQAWLSDFRQGRLGMVLQDGVGVVLDFILVPDHLRRSGFAKALIRACEQRWPELILTDPISEAGARLSDSVTKPTYRFERISWGVPGGELRASFEWGLGLPPGEPEPDRTKREG